MSQTEQIKNHLETGQSITPLEALGLYGCFRLAARIQTLRDTGMKIVTLYLKHSGKRFACYVAV